MSNNRRIQWSLILAVFTMLAFPLNASAQTPPRFYWKDLIGVQAVPVIFMDMSGNANPLDPAHNIVAQGDFDATVAIGGYARSFKAFGRSALAAALLPMGRVSGSGNLEGTSFSQTASGFGDPTFEFVVNLVGSKPIMNIPDALRYEPGFSLDFLIDIIPPLGEYDNERAVNLGQNRWMGRFATPIVWQIGDWVPGRRTTLELLPSIWFFGDNDDFVGQNLSTDTKLQVEAHLTRDFHEDLWGSFDLNWVNGAESTIDGAKGEEIDMVGMGFTLGYHINDNVQLTAGYLASINDSAPTDLRMDVFKFSLVFGWHPLVEGMKRLGQ
jgi:hypothetical protein